MSDLGAFHAHARRMATAEHLDSCGLPGKWGRWVHPSPECDGCVPRADRSLWTRLADEIDAYLSSDDTDVDLFGDVTALPVGEVAEP